MWKRQEIQELLRKGRVMKTLQEYKEDYADFNERYIKLGDYL